MRTIRTALAAATIIFATATASPAAKHVIHVSVDGLSGVLLEQLLSGDDEQGLDNFRRLVTEGASTFNARTDFTHTITLPNHTSMLTGRPVLKPEGQPETVPHGYTHNSTPESGWTLHNHGNPAVEYVASVFDVCRDHGLTTGLFASKSKFTIYDRSYNKRTGAKDLIDEDNGRDKIGRYSYKQNAEKMHKQCVDFVKTYHPEYCFVHYHNPDSAGHEFEWGSPEWIEAVREVDECIGELLEMIEKDDKLRGKTVLIITADHGGLEKDHVDSRVRGIYTIPVFVWGAGVKPGADLYALNPRTRQDPGEGRPDYNAKLQPIRNGDTGNLALSLLRLDPIPGSSINVYQDLRVTDAR